MANPIVDQAANIDQELSSLKNRMGTDRVVNRFHVPESKGVLGRARAIGSGMATEAYRRIYPEKFKNLSSSVLNSDRGFLRTLIGGASQQPGAFTGANQAANEGFSAASKAFTQTIAHGRGRLGLSMPTRLMLNANWSATKMGARAMGAGVRGANMASKMVLGAGLGQIGFAAAVVGGIGYGIGNALGITGPQAAQAASVVHQTFKQMNKPVYGYSEIGQSTQGLVFGLHNRRNG